MGGVGRLIDGGFTVNCSGSSGAATDRHDPVGSGGVLLPAARKQPVACALSFCLAGLIRLARGYVRGLHYIHVTAASAWPSP
jgi:hypothetical protein